MSIIYKRNKYIPLTETTFYILLVLQHPSHGYQIMQMVEELSQGEVRIAAGTMYGALDNLLKQRLIQSVHTNDTRRKVYEISLLGREVLNVDMNRLKHMCMVADAYGRQK